MTALPKDKQIGIRDVLNQGMTTLQRDNMIFSAMQNQCRRSNMLNRLNRERFHHSDALLFGFWQKRTQRPLSTRPGTGVIAALDKLVCNQGFVVGKQLHQRSHILDRWFIQPGPCQPFSLLERSRRSPQKHQ